MTISRRTFLQGSRRRDRRGARPWAAAQGAPIRVGLMTVKTGPLASGGLDMERALVMYLRERNSTLAGRKVALSVADTGGVPAKARTKLQELLEKERVQVLIGPLDAASRPSPPRLHPEQQLPTLSVAAAEDMTQRKTNPWFVRATSTSSQCAQPLADYCYKTLGYKRHGDDGRRHRLRP